MDNLSNADGFCARLTELVRDLHRPVAGASFSIALTPFENKIALVAGRAIFLEEEVPVRPRLTYPTLTLIDEWLPIGSAIERLRLLLRGEWHLDERPVYAKVTNTNGERQIIPHVKHSGWPEWVFSSSFDQSGTHPTVPYGRIVRLGHPPYLSGAEAIGEWVFRQPPDSRERFTQPQFLTVIPDTRGRIVSAEWKPRVLSVNAELGCPAGDVELQAVFSGSHKSRDAVLPLAEGQKDYEIPDDARSIWLTLVHQSGVQLAEVQLSHVERVFAEEAERLPVDAQLAQDLEWGETDEVEFKQFIRPGDPKENDLLETVIAFANTRGGRIYLGVDDHRDIQGRGAFYAAFPPPPKGSESTPEIALRKWANKLVGDKVKPVPQFSVECVERAGEPVACIAVARGTQRPYATHNNKIYIRKGASDVAPDPLTELRPLLENESLARASPSLSGDSSGDDRY